jgi:hypothetical protein
VVQRDIIAERGVRPVISTRSWALMASAKAIKIYMVLAETLLCLFALMSIYFSIGELKDFRYFINFCYMYYFLLETLGFGRHPPKIIHDEGGNSAQYMHRPKGKTFYY